MLLTDSKEARITKQGDILGCYYSNVSNRRCGLSGSIEIWSGSRYILEIQRWEEEEPRFWPAQLEKSSHQQRRHGSLLKEDLEEKIRSSVLDMLTLRFYQKSKWRVWKDKWIYKSRNRRFISHEQYTKIQHIYKKCMSPKKIMYCPRYSLLPQKKTKEMEQQKQTNKSYNSRKPSWLGGGGGQ